MTAALWSIERYRPPPRSAPSFQCDATPVPASPQKIVLTITPFLFAFITESVYLVFPWSKGSFPAINISLRLASLLSQARFFSAESITMPQYSSPPLVSSSKRFAEILSRSPVNDVTILM